HGRCWPRPPGPPPAVVAPPPAALPLRFHCGTPAALRSGPSQCTACPPTDLLGRQKVRQRVHNVPLNRPLQMPAHHTSGRSLLAADTPALAASPATKTAPAPSPAPAAAPSPTQAPESAPTAPPARAETPQPYPACSSLPAKTTASPLPSPSALRRSPSRRPP